MTNLTKPKNEASWQTPKYDAYPIYQHQGTNYRLVPDSVLTKMHTAKDNWFWIAIGMAAVAIAAVTSVLVDAMKPAAPVPQAQIIEKPVVVTQEKVVPTNCIAFCGK